MRGYIHMRRSKQVGGGEKNENYIKGYEEDFPDKGLQPQLQ